MLEPDRTSGEYHTPPKGRAPFLQLLQTVLAFIGALATLFGCLIVFLLLTNPRGVQAFILELYPVTMTGDQAVEVAASLPTYTPFPTQTPLPTYTLPPEIGKTPTPESISGRPSGDWAVRAYRTDDRNVVLVNGHIVAASTYADPARETGWIGINDLLEAETSNHIGFVNLNGQGAGTWGFAIRQSDSIVWSREGDVSQANTLGYVQTVQILPDARVQEVNLIDPQKEFLSGSWAARVISNDIGLLLVNGVPAAGSYDGKDFGWFNISSLLYANEDNRLTALVWNFADDFSWEFSIRSDETTVWESKNDGIGLTGEVYFTSVIIDGEGNLIR